MKIMMKTFDVDKELMGILLKQVINVQSLEDYIWRQIKEKHYSNCLNEIIIGDEETRFNHFYKKLFINFKELLEEGSQLFERDIHLSCYKDTFINLWLILMTIHEMEHIKQRSYFYGGAKNYLEDYICREIIFSRTKITESDYLKYHDYFLYERLATFSAFGSILDLFSKMRLDFDLYDCFLQYMLYYINVGYVVSEVSMKSPLEIVFELMKINLKKMKRLMIKDNMSFLERAQFGLPLELEQYNKVRTNVIKLEQDYYDKTFFAPVNKSC